MKKASIDILMAVYNGEKYIIPQLQSIMEQTYQDFRVVIRDNCSTDGTVEKIESFRQDHVGKIQLIRGETNLGAKGNFATLMNFAEADYVMFSDADDVWLPTKIEKTLVVMKDMEKKFGVNIPLLVHTDLVVVNRELQMLSPSFWQYSCIEPETADELNRLLIHNVITGCTTIINRSLYQLAMPIPESAIMHDWWIGLVASAFGRIGVVPEATLLYRQHGNNDTGAKPGVNLRSPKSALKAFKKACDQEKRDQMRLSLRKTIEQAVTFLARYESRLSDHQRSMVEDYCAMRQEGALRKRYLLMRHRFFKNGLAKNVGTFLFI